MDMQQQIQKLLTRHQRKVNNNCRLIDGFANVFQFTAGEEKQEEELEELLSLTQLDWDAILDGSTMQTFAKDDVIVEQGNTARRLYQVLFCFLIKISTIQQ